MPRPRIDVARPAGRRRGRAGHGRPIERRQNGQGIQPLNLSEKIENLNSF